MWWGSASFVNFLLLLPSSDCPYRRKTAVSLLPDGPLTVRWGLPLLPGGIGHLFFPVWPPDTGVLPYALPWGEPCFLGQWPRGRGEAMWFLLLGGEAALPAPSPPTPIAPQEAGPCYWSRWNEGQLPAWAPTVPSREGWAPVTASGRQDAATCLVLAGVDRGGATAVSVMTGSSREIIVWRVSVFLSCPFLCPLSKRRGCYWGYFCLHPLAFSVPNLGHLKWKRNARTYHHVLPWPPRSPVDLLPFLHLHSLMFAFSKVQGVPSQPSWEQKGPTFFRGPSASSLYLYLASCFLVNK